jgi:hypothetical protein
MGAKLNSKTHLLNTFFDFEPVFARLTSKFEKSTNMTLKNFFLEKIEKVSKNAEFHADFESVEKVVKKCTVTFLLITFFGKLFQNFFNGFEISVKFCVF